MRLIPIICFCFLVLGACVPTTETSTPPPLRAAHPAKPAQPSIESQQIAGYYAAIEARLRAQGKLRQERYPSDARFTRSQLVRNFEQITFYDEYVLRNGVFIEAKTASRLSRWQRPVRINLKFGASLPPAQRAKDTASVKSFAHRLRRLSGLNISLGSAQNANFTMLFMNKDEQRHFAKNQRGTVNFLSSEIADEIGNSPRGVYCAAYALSNPNDRAGYRAAIILIKDEHAGLMRTSCIQEEMAQALGLANDSPHARPSIFNDDEEFALMTRHDELLLQILYDPRLKIGMTIKQAHPIVVQIVNELMSSGQS